MSIARITSLPETERKHLRETIDDTEQLIWLGPYWSVSFWSEIHSFENCIPKVLLPSAFRVVWPMGGTGTRLKGKRRMELELLYSLLYGVLLA